MDTTTKITGLSAHNVDAIQQVSRLGVLEVQVETTATTATFHASPRAATRAVEHAISSLPGRGHPRASLHAVRRRLAAQVDD